MQMEEMTFSRLIGSGYLATAAHAKDGTYRRYLHVRVPRASFVDQLAPFFSGYCLRLHPLSPPPPRVAVSVDGCHGLELATELTDGPTVSIESAVLYRLVASRAEGMTDSIVHPSAASTFTCASANGWVGFITGQFFQYVAGESDTTIAGAVLNDRYGGLLTSGSPRKAIDSVADILKENEWDGAPDLTLWKRDSDELLLYEVKTQNDRLSGVQKRVLGDASRYAKCTIIRALSNK